jgi:hypothetical protein
MYFNDLLLLDVLLDYFFHINKWYNRTKHYCKCIKTFQDSYIHVFTALIHLLLINQVLVVKIERFFGVDET